jgi:dTDP-4-amino-4,6-dideoxygalactose transaminase
MTPAPITHEPPLPPMMHARIRRGDPPFPLGSSACRLFARARHGLYAGVRALGLGRGDEVLVPAWHHGSEVEAFRRAGLVCRFYEATDDLEPDEGELEHLLTGPVRALHLVHYAGVPRDARRWRSWCDQRGLLLFEDAAQAWLSWRDGAPVGSHGDLSVFCLYKTYGLPDGAAVVCRRPPPPLVDRPVAGVGALARRHASWVLQRSAALAALRARLPRPPALSHAEDIELGEPRPPSRATTRLLPRLDSSAARGRRAHYEALLAELRPAVPPPFDVADPGASPYVLPLRTGDKEGAMARLAAAGILTLSLWTYPHPSLPAGFPRAREARRTYVGLPVHQELRPGDVDRILAAVRRAVPELR